MRRGDLITCFNPRTREGCDVLLLKIFLVTIGFNPRTREGCDRKQNKDLSIVSVFQSAHPRRVRLCLCVSTRTTLVVSIRAPAKGATVTTAPDTWVSVFQSAHPRRVRPEVSVTLPIPTRVSIRAPAKGATAPRSYLSHLLEFQSAHPRRVRLTQGFVDSAKQCFNPRTREGCDLQ